MMEGGGNRWVLGIPYPYSMPSPGQSCPQLLMAAPPGQLLTCHLGPLKSWLPLLPHTPA